MTETETNQANEHGDDDALLAAAFRDNPVAMAVWRGPEAVVVDVNAAFEELFGRKREQVNGRSIDSLGLCEDDAKRASFARGSSGGAPLQAECTWRDETGELRHVRITARPLASSNGACMAAAFFDDTERKRAEAAAETTRLELAKRDARLRQANRLAGLGAWERDLVTSETWWSENLYRLLGLPNDTPASFERFRAALYPEDRAKFGRMFELGLARGSWAERYRVVRSDGEIRHVDAVGQTTTDASGRPVRVFGTVLDVTDQTRVEAELRASEERYRRVFEGAVEGIYQTESDGTIVHVNRAFSQMLGVASPELLAGRNLADFFEPSAREEASDTSTLQADIVAGVETPWVRADGARLTVELSGRAIRDERGERVGYHGIARNVTVERQQRRAMRVLSTGLARLTGMAFFDAMVTELARIVGAESAFVRRLKRDPSPRFTALSDVTSGVISHDVALSSAIGLSDFDRKGGALLIPTGAQRVFPEARRLREMNADGYATITLHDSSGEVIGALGVASQKAFADIEHVESLLRLFAVPAAAELERQRVEARFEGVFESAPDALVIANRRGAIVQANAAATTLFGHSREQLLQLRVEDLMPESARAGHPALREGFLASSRTRRMGSGTSLVWALGRDGVPIEVEISLSALDSDEGPLVVAAIRDVTEQLRVARRRDAIERELSQFKKTLDRTADAILMFEPVTLRVVYANEGAVLLTGYSRDELLTMTPLDLRSDEDEVRYRRVLETLLHHDQPVTTFETTHTRKDGRKVPVEVVVQFVAPEGESPRFIKVIRDISERKRVEKMKDEFVSVVSHELRTPLTSIRGALGLVANGVMGPLSKDAAECVNIALSNSDRLSRLINDILDFEKVQSGTFELQVEDIDMQVLLQQSVRANAAYAAAHGVGLSLVSTAETATARADEDRVMQVLANLISNAVKYSPKGEVVEVALTATGADVRVSVRDRGPGISEEFRGRIFGRFAQADSSDTRSKGGTGLGLSISKALVERMGGEIGFTTAAEAGTTFYFYLPRAAHA